MNKKIVTILVMALMAVTQLLSTIDVYASMVEEGNTEDEVIAGTEDSRYIDTIDMYEDEVLELYNQYLLEESKLSTVGVDEYSEKSLDEFVQYAVDEGIIANTAVAKDALTVAVLRTEFKAVVAGGNALGYTTAATLLSHSLQDNPSNLTFSNTSSVASLIKSSREYKAIINNAKSNVKNSTAETYYKSGSITLNSTTDLHLAFNKVNFAVRGVKKNSNTWTFSITITDTYDFDKQAWSNSMTSSSVVTVINNYAAYAQSMGAIVPYKVTVITQKTVTIS